MTSEDHKSSFQNTPSAEEVHTPKYVAWLERLGARVGLRPKPTLRESLETMLKQEAKDPGSFSAEESRMLLGLLRFGASRIEDIMVPRADIIAVEETEPLRELVLMFEESGVSRIPIYH